MWCWRWYADVSVAVVVAMICCDSCCCRIFLLLEGQEGHVLVFDGPVAEICVSYKQLCNMVAYYSS